MVDAYLHYEYLRLCETWISFKVYANTLLWIQERHHPDFFVIHYPTLTLSCSVHDKTENCVTRKNASNQHNN